MSGKSTSVNLTLDASTPTFSRAAVAVSVATFSSVFTAIVLPSRSFGDLIEPSLTRTADQSSSSVSGPNVPAATIWMGRPFSAAIRTETTLLPPICASPLTIAGMIAAPPAAVFTVTSSPRFSKKPCFTPAVRNSAGMPATSCTANAVLSALWPAGVSSVPSSSPPQPARTASIAATRKGVSARVRACRLMSCLLRGNRQVQEPLSVPCQDQLPVGRGELDGLEVCERGADVAGALLRIERGVRREEDVLGAEELEHARERVRRAHHRRVDVEHPEVVHGPARDARLDVGALLIRRASAQLIPTRPHAAGEVRDHPAAVVGEDLETGVTIEHAVEDDAGHERRCLVRPAERPPDLVLRGGLADVVGEALVAVGVRPHHPVALGHLRPEGPQVRRVPRHARDARVDLDAQRAEVVDRTIDLVERRVQVVERQRGDEP